MKRLSYIQSTGTGTHSIITGIVPTPADMLIKIGFTPLAETGGQYFGCNERDMAVDYQFFKTGGITYFDCNGRIQLSGGLIIGQRSDLELGNCYVKYQNGSTIMSGAARTSNPNTMEMRIMNGQMKLYYFQVYKLDVLVGDFIPVLDDNDIACLWDNVTETYFYDENGTTFLYAEYNNYESVEDILLADSSIMETYLDNTANNSTDTRIDGVEWLYFNNILGSNIYVGQNSYIGIGNITKAINVNYRDTVVYNIYREEGTLYNRDKFLRIRWDGYAVTDSIDEAEKLTYDVIFFDTGDIMIHMINIPNTNDGTYALQVGNTIYNFTVDTETPDVSFYKVGADNTYTVVNEAVIIAPPMIQKYLIQVDDKYFTYIDEVVTEITAEMVAEKAEPVEPEEPTPEEGEGTEGDTTTGNTEEGGNGDTESGDSSSTGDNTLVSAVTLNAKLYQDFGINEADLTAELAGTILNELLLLYPTATYKLLYWQDNTTYKPFVKAAITATPHIQEIITNGIIIIPDDAEEDYQAKIIGISSVEVTGEGDFLIAFSFNDDSSWKYWDGSVWQDASEETVRGMTATVTATITEEQWYLLFKDCKKYYIKVTLLDETQSVENIKVNYVNP